MLNSKPDENNVQKLLDFISDIEKFRDKLNSTIDNCINELESLREEYDSIVSEAKIQRHLLFTSFGVAEGDVIPDVDIRDEKLKKAWVVLYSSPDGATAEVIAQKMGRHRTTVSTYLNMLVQLDYAEKEKKGHEIIYKVINRRKKNNRYGNERSD